MKHFKKTFGYIIPLIVSAGLCYLLFSKVNAGELLEAMQQCRWPWMAASLSLGVAAQVWRAYRWRLQLTPLDIKPPIHAMINSIFGTYAVNLVFPRLGEVWRTGYIANRQQAPFAAVFGSMIADRLADSVTVLLITALTFIAASQAMTEFLQVSDAGRRLLHLLENPWLWTALIITGVALAWIIWRNPRNKAVSKIRELLIGAWQGFASIMRMPHKWRWLLFTIAIWGSYFLEMYISMLAFPATADALTAHGSIVAFVAFVFGSIAMAIPSNGGIGPWQAAVVLALSGIYGVDSTVALAFATLALGLQTVVTIMLGLYAFGSIAWDKRHEHKHS